MCRIARRRTFAPSNPNDLHNLSFGVDSGVVVEYLRKTFLGDARVVPRFLPEAWTAAPSARGYCGVDGRGWLLEW
jgi:hypothetical protein